MVKLALILVFLASVHALYVKNSYMMKDDKQIQFIGKFGLAPGEDRVRIRGKLSRPNSNSSVEFHQIELLAVKDEYQTSSLFQCMEPTPLEKYTLDIPNNRTWSDLLQFNMTPTTEGIWAFYISNCAQLTTKEIKVKLEFEVTNQGNSHLSSDKSFLLNVYYILLLLHLTLFGVNLYRLCTVQTQDTSTEGLLTSTTFSQFFELSSFIFYIIHLAYTKSSHKGLPSFYFFGTCTHIMSIILTCTQILAMADGWTMRYRSFPAADNNIPLAITTCIVGCLFYGGTKLMGESHILYGDLDGLFGYGLILFTAVISIGTLWFMSGWKSEESRVNTFMRRFSVIALGWLIGNPAAILFGKMLIGYYRTLLYEGALLVGHFAICLFFTLILTKGSLYFSTVKSIYKDLPKKRNKDKKLN